MVMNIADALAAYRQSGGSPGKSGVVSTGGESFEDALQSFAGDAVQALKEGEKAAFSGATGKTDLTSMVTAINNAELMLQTVVAIRDKVIAAYQDITRTAI